MFRKRLYQRQLSQKYLFLVTMLCVVAITSASAGFHDDVANLVQSISQELAWGGSEITVGLGNFTYGNSGMGSDFSYHFATEVEHAIASDSRLRLIERLQLQTILNEQNLQMSDLIDPDTAIRVGKIVGLDAMIVGTFALWGEDVRVSAKIIHVQTGDAHNETQVIGGIPSNVEIKPANYDQLPPRIEQISDILPQRPEVSISQSNSDFRITIETDRGQSGTYFNGDPLTLYVKSEVSCYIEIYNIEPDGRIHQIFPNQYWATHHPGEHPFISAGVRHPIPYDDSFTLRIGGTLGVETLKIVASTTPFPNVREEDYRQRGPFPDYGDINQPHTIENLRQRVRSVLAEPGGGSLPLLAQASCTIVTLKK